MRVDRGYRPRASGSTSWPTASRTPAQLAALCGFGVGFAQGFLIARPLPLAGFLALLADGAGGIWPGLVGPDDRQATGYGPGRRPGLLGEPARWPRRGSRRPSGVGTGGPGPRCSSWPRSSSPSKVLRHSRRIDPVSTATWRGFAAIAGLLALGHLVRALADVGVNPRRPACPTFPWRRPVRSPRDLRATGALDRRPIRLETLLDAAVALTALGVLLEMLVPLTVGSAHGPASLLLTVGYPAISAVLCAAGLVTFAGVSAPRRGAAAWLLLTFASLAVVMTCGALAVGRPHPSSTRSRPLRTWRCWPPRPRRCGSIPARGRASTSRLLRCRSPGSSSATAWASSSCCSSWAGLWPAGRSSRSRRPPSRGLMLLTFARTLLWARDGARLTRQVLRTEVFSAPWCTLRRRHDRAGQPRAGTGPRRRQPPPRPGPPDLEGALLRDFVHPDDRNELYRALHPAADADDTRGPVFRLRRREGSGGSSRRSTAGLSGARGVPRGTSSGRSTAQRPGRAGPAPARRRRRSDGNWSSSAWPTPTT